VLEIMCPSQPRVTEFGSLTSQAAEAAQAVRESMRQVGLAAAALALPEPATE
jgi:hypothetical protein